MTTINCWVVSSTDLTESPFLGGGTSDIQGNGVTVAEVFRN